jgi:hypothetical protein
MRFGLGLGAGKFGQAVSGRGAKASSTFIRTFARTAPTKRVGYFTASSGSARTAAQAQTQRVAPRTILQNLRSRFLHTTRSRRATPSPNPTPELNSPEGSLSLSQRLRKLTREYGWSAVGVYFMLSALDFPFCYLLVRYLGTDRIGEWEHIVVSNVQKVIPESVKKSWHDWRESVKQAELNMTGKEKINDGVEMAGWGVEEAEANNKRDASLATQLALAYAIHKSFIFIRVPITAAITPRVVKVLRGWGWDIGKRTTKAAKAANVAKNAGN